MVGRGQIEQCEEIATLDAMVHGRQRVDASAILLGDGVEMPVVDGEPVASVLLLHDADACTLFLVKLSPWEHDQQLLGVGLGPRVAEAEARSRSLERSKAAKSPKASVSHSPASARDSQVSSCCSLELPSSVSAKVERGVLPWREKVSSRRQST